jgi:hypothetical protein
MENKIEILGNEDVVSSESPWLLGSKTYTIEEFLEAARGKLKINGEICDEEWLVRTEKCRVLRVGELQGWRQGQLKIRMKVMFEFEPESLPEVKSDEAESLSGSPLDRLRS